MLRETQVKVRFNRISFKQILPKQKNGVLKNCVQIFVVRHLGKENGSAFLISFLWKSDII